MQPSEVLEHPARLNPSNGVTRCPRLSPLYRNSTISVPAISPTSTASSARKSPRTRKRAVAGELIRRDVSEVEGALFRSVIVAETMVATLDRAGIEGDGRGVGRPLPEMVEALCLIKTGARTGAVRLAA